MKIMPQIINLTIYFYQNSRKDVEYYRMTRKVFRVVFKNSKSEDDGKNYI